ncbi:hypothetical protein J1614_004684 [Plenodomus biglobosus]|nr:hypothetical protein J1614_004684 [Plenodomus biglobosus]
MPKEQDCGAQYIQIRFMHPFCCSASRSTYLWMGRGELVPVFPTQPSHTTATRALTTLAHGSHADSLSPGSLEAVTAQLPRTETVSTAPTIWLSASIVAHRSASVGNRMTTIRTIEQDESLSPSTPSRCGSYIVDTASSTTREAAVNVNTIFIAKLVQMRISQSHP